MGGKILVFMLEFGYKCLSCVKCFPVYENIFKTLDKKKIFNEEFSLCESLNFKLLKPLFPAEK